MSDSHSTKTSMLLKACTTCQLISTDVRYKNAGTSSLRTALSSFTTEATFQGWDCC